APSTGPRRRRRRTPGRPGEPLRPRPGPSPPASASSPATLFPSALPQHSHTTASRYARYAERALSRAGPFFRAADRAGAGHVGRREVLLERERVRRGAELPQVDHALL